MPLIILKKASKLKDALPEFLQALLTWITKLQCMHPSDLVLIAGPTLYGKTAFVLNIAQYMAFRKDVTVAIFSLEMSKEQLVNRLLAMESHVDSQNMRTGNLKDEDWTKLVEGADIIGRSNLIIDDAGYQHCGNAIQMQEVQAGAQSRNYHDRLSAADERKWKKRF